ncbi:MAG: GDCCVxC domain-containing (seleno)protein [Rhodospirillaceae bacterium]|nr:GDCCVxC domain-containing (seleno)protein [Rhodospirillaceae bacterium]
MLETPLVQTTSTIACPRCGVSKIEIMPTDSCQYFYDCAACGALLRPKPGHCCVFCSYGNTPCPPKQVAASLCESCR